MFAEIKILFLSLKTKLFLKTRRKVNKTGHLVSLFGIRSTSFPLTILLNLWRAFVFYFLFCTITFNTITTQYRIGHSGQQRARAVATGPMIIIIINIIIPSSWGSVLRLLQ